MIPAANEPEALAEGLALLAQGALRPAVDAIERAIDAAPHHPHLLSIHREVGLALYARSMWTDALPWLLRAQQVEPWDQGLAWIVDRITPDPALAPEVFDPQLGRTLRRYRAQEGAAYIYAIDIAGTCNLRCPTCPVGNSPLDGRKRGMMPHGLFERIIAKIRRESPSARPQINLFNWGEPLLHPELPRFIATIRAAGMTSHLSTNLNVRRGLDEMIAAEPDDLKLSLSGWAEATYATTHKGGDIGLVRANLRLLRDSIERHNARTHVWVSHHLYRSNLHELDTVRQDCAALGFEHHPIQAFYMPLERLHGLLQGRPNPADSGIVADLLISPQERAAQIDGQRGGGMDCELRFNQTVINHDGTVALCCSVYDQANMLGVDFLAEDHAAIEARKYRHSFCATCIGANLHYTQPELRPDPMAAMRP